MGRGRSKWSVWSTWIWFSAIYLITDPFSYFSLFHNFHFMFYSKLVLVFLFFFSLSTIPSVLEKDVPLHCHLHWNALVFLFFNMFCNILLPEWSLTHSWWWSGYYSREWSVNEEGCIPKRNALPYEIHRFYEEITL